MNLRGKFFRLLFMLVLVPSDAQSLTTETLTILTKNGTVHQFTVEVPENKEEILRGLMFRTHLPAGAGMLFDFGEDGPLVFWMKNTLISLDMIFIGSDGRIRAIAQHTVPLSEEYIRSPVPGRAVLELNGGSAERLGIAVGDLVRHRIFLKN